MTTSTRQELIEYGITKFITYCTTIKLDNDFIEYLEKLQKYPIEIKKIFIEQNICAIKDVNECYQQFIKRFNVSDKILNQTNEKDLKNYIIYFQKVLC